MAGMYTHMHYRLLEVQLILVMKLSLPIMSIWQKAHCL